MATQILVKKSGDTGNSPEVTDLAYGELALNYADGKVFYKSASNQIKAISIALAGDVTGEQMSNTIANTTVTGKLLTNYISTTGTIAQSDSILSALGKLNGNVALKAPLNNPTFTGTVNGITQSMVGLSNVNNTSDANKPVSEATQLALNDKVNKVFGQGLSDENYTLTEKNKLATIASGAEVNVNADWTATTGDAFILNKPILGTAAASEVSDFATAAQGALADNSLQSVPVDYRGTYNNGDGTYGLGAVVLYNGLLYEKLTNWNNPGYPPTGPDWQLFEPPIGSPAYDLFAAAQLNSKVDKVDGQSLSDENYTLAEKNKLDAIVPSKLINGTNEVELGADANLYLAQGGGIVFDQNNTSINVGMGFHIRSGEGVSIEPVDQADSENLITRGWVFDPSGSLTAPANDGYYARSYIVLNTFPAQDSGFGLTTPDGITHDFYYDYDGITGPGTPILINSSTDTITDVANKTITVLNNSALFGDIHWDTDLNYIWVYQNVAGETGDQTNFNYGYTDGVSPFEGGQSSKIVFGDGTIQTTAAASSSYLLDRTHHTGTQSYSTVTGLGTLATQDGTFSGTSSGTNTGDQTITLGGDATGNGTSLVNVTLANTGVVAGEYNNSTTTITPFTVDSKGRITATNNEVTITPDWNSVANTPSTLSGYDITDAVNLDGTQTISGAKEFTTSPIVPRPTESGHAATKAYADDISAGLHVHEQVHVILTVTLASATGGTVVYTNGTDGVGAKLTVTGGSTIIAALNSACGADDDLAVGTPGSRIIVNGEGTNKNWNGIYTITADRELTRAADFDSPVEMAGGDFVFVTHGTTHADTGWVLGEPVVTVGSSNVEFVQFSGQGSYDAGDGLHRDGTVFSVVGTTGRIVVGPSVDLAMYGPGVGTYRSITTDVYGRVTSGTNPTTLDGYGITDAASLTALSTHVSDDDRHLTSTQNTFIDGITVTSTKINYLSDVTSAVQAQLDDKSATSHEHANATTSIAGFMSATDKLKLDAISGSNTGDQTITLSGDVTGTGTGTFTTTLKNTGPGVGTYRSVTIDAKGRVTAGTNPTTLDDYGITEAAALSGATFTGNISAANLSGTNTGDETGGTIKTKLGITILSGNNTGDQTITLSGDVIGSGTGNFTTTLKETGSPGTYNNSATAVTPFTTDAAGRISSTGTALTITPAWSSITSTPTTMVDYGITAPIVLISGATTFANTDNEKIFHVSGETTLTLPPASTVSDGWSIGIVNVGGNKLTINRSASDTVNGLTTFYNTIAYSAIYIYKSSSSTFVAIGILY